MGSGQGGSVDNSNSGAYPGRLAPYSNTNPGTTEGGTGSGVGQGGTVNDSNMNMQRNISPDTNNNSTGTGTGAGAGGSTSGGTVRGLW
jgi:hypothetical protein